MSYTPLRDVPNLIQSKRTFTANSMSARWDTTGFPTGMLNDQECSHVALLDNDDTVYVVYSYRTPVAWCQNGSWHVVTQKFSRTTSRHQSAVRSALSPTLAA